MGMDNATRLEYLKAMGIEVWVSRLLPVVPESVEQLQFSTNPAVTETQVQPPQLTDNGFPEIITDKAPNIPAESLAIGRTASHQLHTTNENAWITLQQEVAACRQCGLCETRTQTVFGVGNRQANWMLIGEAPGQDEDLRGEPFVGKAGQLLTEMLRAMGLKREEVYIANMLKCRPPHNRDPSPEEISLCRHFLTRQIALIQPKLILAVGRIAAQNLLATTLTMSKLRGIRHQLDNIPLIVIYHPAYLLRSLSEKAKAWEDLKFALKVYEELEK